MRFSHKAIFTSLFAVVNLSAFDIGRDTLYAYEHDNTDRVETFLINNSDDLLIIDSIDVEEIEIHADQYNLKFELRTKDTVSNDTIRVPYQFEREGGYIHGTRKRTMAVRGNETVKIHDLHLDLCLWCTSLPKQRSTSAVNDPMIFKLTVHAGDDEESVIIKSKQRVAKPKKPSGLAAEPLSENAVRLTWDNPNDGATTQWHIYREGELVGITTERSFIDSSLYGALTVFYRISAANSMGMESDKTSAVSATTPSDSKPPDIDIVGCFHGPDKVWVIFNEPLEKPSAENKSNYQIDQNIRVKSAVLLADYRTVELMVDSLEVFVQYKLTVNNVYDMSDFHNKINDNTEAVFRIGGVFDDFEDNSLDPVWKEVDTDNWNGSSVNEKNNQLELKGRGKDVNGASNEFIGVFREDIFGDFDVSVKVVSFTNTDNHARCGIMAANDITDPSKGGYCVAGAFPTRTYRAVNTGGTIGQFDGYDGGDQVNLPCWLRLKKTGTSFQFYYKTSELTDWIEIGNAASPMQTEANSQICLFACSHNTGAEAIAVFDDFNAGSSGRTPPAIIPIAVPVAKPIEKYAQPYSFDIINGRLRISQPGIQWKAYLFDASGRLIFTQSDTGNKGWTIPLQSVRSGIQFLRIESPGIKIDKKLTIMK